MNTNTISDPIKVGIIGATGYTGAEVVRLIAGHPKTIIYAVAAGRESKGRLVADVWPHLSSICDAKLLEADNSAFASCDVVLMATPDGIAMKLAPPLLEAGVRVIDLSADFRLRDAKARREWYGAEALAGGNWLQQAVYGLPELFPGEIEKARLIANPGCFPTAVALALAPALKDGLIDPETIIVDAKTGTSGAGRNKAPPHAETSDSICAYALSGHRHTPEMVQALCDYSKADNIRLVFVPHLTPMRRGILATMYVKAKNGGSTDSIKESLHQAYQGQAFVVLAPDHEQLATATVAGSNLCRLAVRQQGHAPDTIIVMSVIDNLVKGAAGQAVQNMNLMFQMPQHAGLTATGMVP
ncbi:MAG: N-acetyl-gamma-glutamyl-phosphate reductase [Candidatus Porifericomitaceae bacterium WSBS_2022_MAG_OTU9]